MTSTPRVIFLDDDPDILAGYRRALRKKSIDWDIVFFTAQGEALEEYRAHHSAILVTDYFMPGLGGLDVLRLAREMHSDARVIVVSGSIEAGGGDVLAAATKMGAARTFTKPFQMTEMVRAIEALLGGA